jgi:hypothetical protein
MTTCHKDCVPEPGITLVDEFRILIALQCRTRDGFWDSLYEEWKADWITRGVLNALVNMYVT